MYQLVIAEKPSVAMSIAKVLGATARKEGHMEGGGWLVSWCVGHLAELAEPAVYDPRYGKWRREDLPILPENWRFTVGQDKRGQFDTLRTLLRREDVSEVVNACDAGREGELIFRTAYHLAGCTKPIKRLWISSMEDGAIREGFANLRPGRDYDGLHQAALCRQKADWLVGINATRLFSLLYNRTLNIGRVMSPTLALIVQREAEIAAFTPEPFYTVELDCGGMTATGERISVKKDASALAVSCEGSAAAIQTAERRERSEKPPALYDLTTLQREANRALGYTAQQTLDYLQALYEKKLCTYPRTDSRFLTDDMESAVPALVSAAAAVCGLDAPGEVLASQVCDSGKVTDHHAVVPTKSAAAADLSALPLGEREVLRLVSLALLRAVCPPYRYAETAVVVECAGHSFSAKGKVLLDMGWTRAGGPMPSCPRTRPSRTGWRRVRRCRWRQSGSRPARRPRPSTSRRIPSSPAWRPPGPGTCRTMRSGRASGPPPPAPPFWRSWWPPGWWNGKRQRRSPIFCPPRRAAPSSPFCRRPCNPPC